jgi:ADP-heptose:LPS heptosyltransferase
MNTILQPKMAQKILVVQLGRIGDLILLLPVFEALKKLNPENEIHLLAGKNNYQAVEGHPYIDKIIVYNKSIVGRIQTILELRKEQYDIWIDPKNHHSGESLLFARLGGAKFKIGYEAKPNIFDVQIPHESVYPDKHISYSNLISLASFGINPTSARPCLFVQPLADKQINAFLQENKIQKYFCVNLSGSRIERNWTTEKWIAFLKKITSDILSIVIIAAPAEKDRALQIVAKVSNAVYLETKSIIEVYSVVAKADLVISPDTSIVHIAAAFDKPLLGLYSRNFLNNAKFHPLSSIYELAMDERIDLPISEMSVELVLDAYHRLRKRLI